MLQKTFHEIEHAAWSERAAQYDAIFASVSTQAINPILDALGQLQGMRQLDVACGTGHLVGAASKRGAVSEGVDFAQAMVDVARVNYPRNCFQVADAAQLPQDDRTFDAITCSFGLNHMENPQGAVDEAFRVLKPGGRYAFTLWFGPEDGNELQAIIQQAISAFAVNPLALPKEWVQLRAADETACEVITRQAGFRPPTFKKLSIALQPTSAQEVLDTVNKISIRTKMILDNQPPTVQQKIYETIRSAIESRRADGLISLVCPALLTVVQKPG